FDLSQPRTVGATAVVGSKVFFIGGTYSDANGGQQQSTVVDIFDDVTRTWSTSSCPARQSFGPMARVGNKLIFVDGNFVDVYDTAANAWSTAPFSVARDEMGIATAGTR